MPALPDPRGLDPDASGPRTAFLDTARASMLLLGVPFHAVEPYRLSGDWMLVSPEPSWAASLFGCTVHVFRMPAFFLLAGFFASMLLARRGAGAWLRDRGLRLGVPLVFSLLAFGWIEEAIVLARGEGLGAVDATRAALAAGPGAWSHHRWFLVVLLLHCISLVALRRLVSEGAFEAAFRALHGGPAGTARLVVLLVALPFVAAGIGALTGAGGLGLDGTEPYANFYFRYAPFFLFGYCLHRVDGSMRRFTALGRTDVVIAVLSIAVYGLTYRGFHPEGDLRPDGPLGVPLLLARTGIDLLAGLYASKLFFAAMSRFADVRHPLVDRLVAGSLGVYLVHMVFVLGLGSLLVPTALPPTLEIAIITVGALAASMLAVECARRLPWLSVALNGVRPDARGGRRPSPRHVARPVAVQAHSAHRPRQHGCDSGANMTVPVRPVPDDVARRAHIDAEGYARMYRESVENPNAFWGEHGKRLDWITPYTKVKNTSFAYPDVSIRWYEDGELNVAANCIDRHLATRADQVAIIWEGDDPSVDRKITYRELHDEVCRLANVYKELGVGKGDRIVLYMPMVPEAAFAMLASARIGAIHSIVFGGFSPDALGDRINGSAAKLVVTADEGYRGGRTVPLKANADRAMGKVDHDVQMLVVRRTGGEVAMREGQDHWYDERVPKASAECAPEPMNAEDPLFILYTSGSTGMPKGVVHTTGGYLVYAAMTHEYTFDYHDGDVFWCTADVGWVTGHSYIVYGPLANGATTLMFEGVPTHPSPARFWQVCEKHAVNQFYTAPTAIRALMGAGEKHVEGSDLSALQVLGTVGEPINPEAWNWYDRVVGKGALPIVDTWWQTETGGHLITPLPGATPTKPGSATLPFFGVQPAVLDNEGVELTATEAEGVLVIKDSWPGQMRTVYQDHDRFVSTYFETFKGYYFTGDGCRRDADGYWWITGRVDDVINVSGHRMGTAEVESALVAHDKVSEAAVVGYPHDIKGQGIYAYVTLMEGVEESEELRKELVGWVRAEIGPIASPDKIQFAPGLPKTRSGKIMRRILRKIAEDDFGALGDTSTLADPAVVDDLVERRENRG